MGSVPFITERLDPPQNLLADNAVLDQTSSVVNDTLRAAAQGLLSEIAPQLALDQGDLTMFVMDVPPDVPPQYAPIVVAQAAQTKQQGTGKTIGVCQLIESRPESRESAVNHLSVARVVNGYLKYQEHQSIDDSAILSAKMTLLQAPTHGTLDMGTRGHSIILRPPTTKAMTKPPSSSKSAATRLR